MVNWAVVFNIVGIFFESLAVVFVLKKLVFAKNVLEISDRKFKDERTEQAFTIIFILIGVFLQIGAVIIESTG